MVCKVAFLPIVCVWGVLLVVGGGLQGSMSLLIESRNWFGKAVGKLIFS